MNFKKSLFAFAIAAAAMGVAHAQTVTTNCIGGPGALCSASANVQLNATFPESITINSTQPVINFQLAPDTDAQGDNQMNIKTSWALMSGRTHVYLDAYFNTPSAALTGYGIASNPAEMIPSGIVNGSVNGGTKAPFTGTSPVLTVGGAVGGDLAVFDQPISSSNLSGTRTDDVALDIDLTTAAGATIPPDSVGYTGTVVVVATAI
jgi:hypothetical protein